MQEKRASRLPERVAAPRLLIQARALASGLYSGVHRSPARGGSSEFEDVRPYVPGEPLNRLDWKIAARTDRLFVRQFRREAQQAVMVVLDASASMGFAGFDGASRLRPTKLDRALELAATIAVIVHQQQDRVGVALSNDERVVAPRAGRQGLHAVIDRLEGARAAGDAGFGAALDAMGSQARPPDLVVVLSDCLDEPDRWLPEVARTRRGGAGRRAVDVAVLQVLTEEEMRLPPDGVRLFVDPETGRRTVADPRISGAEFSARLQGHMDDVHRRLAALRVRHTLHLTSSPPLEALVHLFAARAPLLSTTR